MSKRRRIFSSFSLSTVLTNRERANQECNIGFRSESEFGLLRRSAVAGVLILRTFGEPVEGKERLGRRQDNLVNYHPKALEAEKKEKKLASPSGEKPFSAGEMFK